MITRALYLALGWFIISFVAVLLRGRHVKTTNAFLSLLWLLIVLAVGDLWALLTFGVPREMAWLTGIAFVNGLIWLWVQRDWNPLGKVAWSMTLLTTVVFIAYSFTVTAFTPLNPVSFILAMLFFFIEALALLLGLSHAYESLDVINRARWRRARPPFRPDPTFLPKVSLQVPTYNEPPEVVANTLRMLARMDYPNYEVLVVDNNTPDEANWRALEAVCRQLGPRFRLLHLDKWPGFKSGALNFALTQTAPDAEIIGVVDADYQIDPNFLKEIVPAFRDPSVAFVQTPQDYRDATVNSFAETIYNGYKYFFEVSMPVRNEHNAIIFCGTMGLLRRSALEEIGGWDEWCITEDAEASLRILKRGYQSLYIHKTYGKGLMPFSFDGLKKQRFRWGFGGIQILRKHWEALMPWSKAVDPDNHLTGAQKYYYLLGGLQWFTDVFNLLFSIFLVIGAFLAVTNTRVTIRPLTGPLIIVPAVFLLLNTWRFVYVLRDRLSLPIGRAIRAMYGFFSMGWVTVLADFQGLFQPKGVFLRTPKVQGDSKALQAIQVTSWETGLGLVCAAAGVLAFALQPGIRTAFLAALLFWQGSLYLAAPVLSLMSVYSGAQPVAPVAPAVRGTTVVRENFAARWAMAMAAITLAAVLAVVIAGPPKYMPSYTYLQPRELPAPRLFGAQPVPLNQRENLPTADTGAILPVTGGSSPTATPAPTEKPKATKAAPTATPAPDKPTATQVKPSPTVPPTLAPTLRPTVPPTLPPTVAPTLTPTVAPTNTAPAPTDTAAPSPTTALPTLVPTVLPPTAVPTTAPGLLPVVPVGPTPTATP